MGGTTHLASRMCDTCQYHYRPDCEPVLPYRLVGGGMGGTTHLASRICDACQYHYRPDCSLVSSNTNRQVTWREGRDVWQRFPPAGADCFDSR